MKLSAPKLITFEVAVAVVILGLIGYFVTIPVLSGLAFWVVVLGFVILAVGNLIEGF